MIMLAFLPNLMQSQNNLMPNELRIKTHVVFEKSKDINLEYPIVYEKKEFQEKPLFLEIMETTLAGKVEAYNPRDPSIYNFNKNKITVSGIKDRMGGGNDTVIVKDDNGKLIQKIFEGKIDLSQIESIYFIDAWNFNVEKFTFTKNVVSYSPIRKFYKLDDIDKEDAKLMMVFVLNFENFSIKEIKRSNKRLIHYATVKYEQLVDNFEEYSSKELDRINRPQKK